MRTMPADPPNPRQVVHSTHSTMQPTSATCPRTHARMLVCQQQCMHQRRASRVGGSLRRYVALEELAPRGKHHRDGEEQIDAAATWHIVTWDAMRWDEMG
jgi:hypothetical protein